MFREEDRARFSGSRDCIWLTGRGASLAAGLDWDESPEIMAIRPRADRIKAICQSLGKAQKENPNVFALQDRFVQLLVERTQQPWLHYFTTLNWDTLLQHGVDHAMRFGRPACILESQVFHLNGAIDSPPDNWSSKIILREDEVKERQVLPEMSSALEYLIWANVVVIVGVSLSFEVDQALLNTLATIEDQVPLGEADILVVNRSADMVAMEIQRRLPRARVQAVSSGFREWISGGMVELGNLGVLSDI